MPYDFEDDFAIPLAKVLDNMTQVHITGEYDYCGPYRCNICNRSMTRLSDVNLGFHMLCAENTYNALREAEAGERAAKRRERFDKIRARINRWIWSFRKNHHVRSLKR